MNALERSYAEHLADQLRQGQILEWTYEAEALRLAYARPEQGVKGATYTPDFRVITADGEVTFHEVKGGLFRDDAKLKLKIAAERHPYRFFLATRAKVRDGGAWTVVEA